MQPSNRTKRSCILHRPSAVSNCQCLWVSSTLCSWSKQPDSVMERILVISEI